MPRSFATTLITALLVTACDAPEVGTQAPEQAPEQAPDNSPVIHYMGERFTMDELGEAPPHLVAVGGGEIYGFDSLEEADEFTRTYAGPDDRTAAPDPTQVPSIGVWADAWGWNSGSQAYGWQLSANANIWYLGDYGLNDRVSAVNNDSNYKVRFYDHAGFGGDSYLFWQGGWDADLRGVGWNDRFSSWKVVP